MSHAAYNFLTSFTATLLTAAAVKLIDDLLDQETDSITKKKIGPLFTDQLF